MSGAEGCSHGMGGPGFGEPAPFIIWNHLPCYPTEQAFCTLVSHKGTERARPCSSAAQRAGRGTRDRGLPVRRAGLGLAGRPPPTEARTSCLWPHIPCVLLENNGSAASPSVGQEGVQAGLCCLLMGHADAALAPAGLAIRLLPAQPVPSPGHLHALTPVAWGSALAMVQPGKGEGV